MVKSVCAHMHQMAMQAALVCENYEQRDMKKRWETGSVADPAASKPDLASLPSSGNSSTSVSLLELPAINLPNLSDLNITNPYGIWLNGKHYTNSPLKSLSSSHESSSSVAKQPPASSTPLPLL